MTPDAAEILSLQALGWLAGDAAALDRFLALTGIGAADLRAGAGTPDMARAVIEFLLLNEGFMLQFCEDASVAPQAIQAARQALETA